ncbi:hypothetical protein LVB77_01560 [Lysobacter sp. 5GHs7-4]|uniref:hypothetical protein n=1 Tax=Lysobacter sp. 5GHs7-4 TaxID=2904253 RepID=UPI001E4B7318|nr:hypothetical protein [Lysobacter sp. 5GHs7-4]UHQ23428.1 hypothetical protein LVB77_01560 [Lysobacter sp. 5GHs7-4]
MSDDDKRNAALEQALATMSPREAKVFRERFEGLSSEEMLRVAADQLASVRARLRELELRTPDDPDDAA